MGMSKPRLDGLNHVALEVGDVEDALRFYEAVFSFELRGTHEDDQGRTVMAFLDMGDQFVALSSGRTQPPDTGRHFGLVVDERSQVMELARAAGATILDRPFNLLDPWGNHLEIVAYRDVQFTKSEDVFHAMGLDLDKSDEAREGSSLPNGDDPTIARRSRAGAQLRRRRPGPVLVSASG